MNKNYEILKEKYADVYDNYISAANREFENERIRAYIDNASNGEEIVAFGIDGIYRYVNSRYNPENAAKVWAEKFANFNPLGMIVVFGIGNGMHIRELLKQLNSTNKVMIIEPNIEMFNIVMTELDISDILSDERVVISVLGISNHIVETIFELGINYSNYKLVVFHYLPNYDKIYKEEFLELYKKFKTTVEGLILSRNTKIAYSKEFIVNLLKNCNDVVNQSTVCELKESFENYDLSGIPAIVVSAGPSLDKNVSELKKAKGKSIIIVVDTALKAVLKAGITPDITVLVDPHKPLELFDYEGIKDIPMVVTDMANYKVIEKHDATRFYFGEPMTYVGYIYKKYTGNIIYDVPSGGSVANNAFSLARILGFKTIILVGQDLAFSGDKSYASSIYNAEITKKVMLGDTEEIIVEDIYGDKIATKKNMELYLRWFEKAIVIFDELKVIDATEGGAKIKGTEIMNLSEAIGKECKKEFDAESIIKNTQKAFTEEQVVKLYEDFRNIPNRLEVLKKKLEAGIRDYNRFGELYRRGKAGTAEFARYVDKIKEANSLMDNEEFSEWLGVYNVKDNYDVIEDIFEFKSDESEEIRAIVDRGIKMLDSYIEAIGKLKEDLPILLEELE